MRRDKCSGDKQLPKGPQRRRIKRDFYESKGTLKKIDVKHPQCNATQNHKQKYYSISSFVFSVLFNSKVLTGNDLSELYNNKFYIVTRCFCSKGAKKFIKQCSKFEIFLWHF